MHFWPGESLEPSLSGHLRGKGVAEHTWRVLSRVLRVFAKPWMIVSSLLILLAVMEMRTSWVESHLLAAAAQRLTYTISAGPSNSIRYPSHGPYNKRLGYSSLPKFLERLERGRYGIDAQARNSPLAVTLMDRGIYPIYREKVQTGLRILDRDGRPLFSSSYPQRTYRDFESIPPIIVQTILFIENREILDTTNPYRNPSVEWDRLGGAFLDLGMNVVYRHHRLSGGSTLATQIEKIRHSPGGRTPSVFEKFRQMASASLRAYQSGADTTETRKLIVRDYLNSIPLAAAAGFGEVQGLGDGLWAWYGADFQDANRLLEADREDLSIASAQARIISSSMLISTSGWRMYSNKYIDSSCNRRHNSRGLRNCSSRSSGKSRPPPS